MLPRISLVTPSYQQANYLEECLRSVHAQEYPGLEHIVVDGGSTDGSREQLERHADHLAWWCSEPDRGQSHAINKGLSHATGSIFGWLNSDDLLLPDALRRVGEAFAAEPNLLVFGGRRVVRGLDGTETVAPLDDVGDEEALFVQPKVNQQSTFFRMDSVRAVNGVDEALHFTMDLELWWRILFANGTRHLQFSPIDLAVFRFHGDSKTAGGHDAFRKETASILLNMAVQLHLEDLADVLRAAPRMIGTVRDMPLEMHHAPIVRRMIVHFLLKWNHVVYDRAQFEMMKRFRREIGLEHDTLDPVHQAWLAELDEQLNVPNWLAFRIKRKIDHLKT